MNIKRIKPNQTWLLSQNRQHLSTLHGRALQLDFIGSRMIEKVDLFSNWLVDNDVKIIELTRNLSLVKSLSLSLSLSLTSTSQRRADWRLKLIELSGRLAESCPERTISDISRWRQAVDDLSLSSSHLSNLFVWWRLHFLMMLQKFEAVAKLAGIRTYSNLTLRPERHCYLCLLYIYIYILVWLCNQSTLGIEQRKVSNVTIVQNHWRMQQDEITIRKKPVSRYFSEEGKIIIVVIQILIIILIWHAKLDCKSNYYHEERVFIEINVTKMSSNAVDHLTGTVSLVLSSRLLYS